MHDTPEALPSFPDDVDQALAAFWRGDSAALDRLVAAEEGDTPGIGALFRGIIIDSHAEPTGTPERIANYRIIRELGRGGMGVVYEARQSNPDRSVALKIVRGEQYVDAHLIKLFKREVQTLARLTHPGIAAIYEAGRTEDGRHFFVMELVPGDSLMEYIRGKAPSRSGVVLPIKERLNLFLKLCEAVNFAHQRGVIHRDLKPSNILVTESALTDLSREAEIKVLDFGLARITDGDIAVSTIAADLVQIQGTLPYMSPEQLRGDPAQIDVRSDAYTLGVLLYEMTTDRLPYDVGRGSLAAAARTICEYSPARPSTVRRELRGDLETILLKALEKEPGRRYQTVAEFGADVLRYLHDQPIQARPPSATYQLRKLAWRNKGLAASICLAAIALVSGSALATWQAVQATRERTRAAQNEKLAQAEALKAVQAESKSRQQTDFLTKLLTQASAHQPGFRNVTVREAVDRATKELDDAPDLPLDVRSAILHTLGSTYATLWEFASAESLLLREREILDQLEDDGLARAENSKLLAQILLETPRAKGAGGYIDEALRIFRRVRGDDDVETLTVKVQQARYLGITGDTESFERILRGVLDTAMQRYSPTHPLAIEAKAHLGLQYRGDKRLKESEQLLTEVLEARSATLGPSHVETLTAMNNLAMAYLDDGDRPAAIEVLTQALAGHQETWGPSHHETYICQINLIDALRAAERWADLEPIARDAIERRAQALRPDEVVLALKPMVALAQALNALNRPAEAIPWYDDVLQSPLLKENAWHAARVRAVRGQCLAALERFDEAERDLLDAKEALYNQSPLDVQFTDRVLTWLIDVYDRSGRSEDAHEVEQLRVSLQDQPLP